MDYNLIPKSFSQMLQVLGRCLLVVLGLYLAGRLGLAIAYTEAKTSLVWLPTGIATAVFFRWKSGYLPVVWLSIVLIELAVHPSLGLSASLAVGSALGPWVVALLLRQSYFDPNFADWRDVVKFFLAAIAGMIIPATGGVLNLWLFGIIPAEAIPQTWWIWWTGDTVGVLLAAPVLVALTRENLWTLVKHHVEVPAFVAVFTLSAGFVFLTLTGIGTPYLVFILVIWASMRYGVLGGTLSVLATAFLAAWGTATGRGPFHAGQEGLLSLWLYVSTLSAMSLMIAALQAVGFRSNLSLSASLEQSRKMALDLAAARDAANEASRAKSEFLANMSHEIRTPLTAILGYAEILAQHPEIGNTPERRQETVESIRAAGQHLLTVINDILDLSKIEANKLVVERIETDLRGALGEVERMIRPRAVSRGLSLSVNLRTPVPDRIMSDPTRLRQILLNLLGNAVKFTETGKVVVSVGAAEEAGQTRLVIEITDTGQGMSSGEIGRLFVEFSQGDTTVTRRHGGTGLGLAISRRLARMMGGELELAWSELDAGSCFRLDLPLVSAPGATDFTKLDHEPSPVPAVAPAPAPRIGLSGKILLTEDCPDLQELVEFFLTQAGAIVETAEHGGMALEKLADAASAGHPFDLLLTDMQMPVMDGYALASELRRRGNSIPIVALTAHSMSDDRQRCLDAGCDDYLMKPIDRQKLLACCQTYLQRSHPAAVHP